MKPKKVAKKTQDRIDPTRPGVVVCVGKECDPKRRAIGLYQQLCRRLSGDACPRAENGPIQRATIACLDVCKHGPVVETLPDGHVYTRVDADKLEQILRRLGGDTAILPSATDPEPE